MKCNNSKSKYWLLLTAIWLCILLLLFFCFLVIREKFFSQKVAENWDATEESVHISCFFSNKWNVLLDDIRNGEYLLEQCLLEQGIVPMNASNRLWIDAYSAEGHISLSSTRSTVHVEAYGVGGDFFYFHPLKLEREGAYFDKTNISNDWVFLDKNTAWQLFGSYDITGQSIIIGSDSNVHIGVVAGVFENDDAWMSRKSAIEQNTIYISYGMLDQYGSHGGIVSYEIVMPNPINGFAKACVEECFGYTESEIEILENSSRYSYWNILKRVGELGSQFWNKKNMQYPQWEIVTRGWEAVLLIVIIVQVQLVVVYVVLSIFILSRNKKD